MLADERASTGHLRGREVRGGAPGEEEQCARAHTSWPFWLLGLPPRSSRAKSSHEGWALGLREEMRGSALVRRVSSGWCGARGAVWSGCVRAVVQEDGRRSEGSEEEMQWRMEAVLAVRRGVVGALASGDARVRRACAAVRGGARAEAGWWRVPRRGLRASWECGCGLFSKMSTTMCLSRVHSCVSRLCVFLPYDFKLYIIMLYLESAMSLAGAKCITVCALYARSPFWPRVPTPVIKCSRYPTRLDIACASKESGGARNSVWHYHIEYNVILLNRISFYW